MNKVYYYLNSHPNAMGVVEILGTKYRISESTPLRHSERPDYRGWTNPQFGVCGTFNQRKENILK